MTQHISPLKQFADGFQAPHTVAYPWLPEGGARVFPVTPKAAIAVARRRGVYVHRILRAAGCMQDGKITYAAYWACRSGSPDVIFLASPEGLLQCPDCLTADRPGVYRCYDVIGLLLYIGSTSNETVRLGQHEKTSPWWPDVARTTFEDYPSLSLAKAAETRAIHAERPLHNEQHNNLRLVA